MHLRAPATAWTLLLLVASAAPSHAQALYSYVDESGVRVFTNIPPKAPVRELRVTGAITPGALSATTPSSGSSATSSYDPIIQKYAGQYGLDPSLVRSMISAESGFNPKAVSPKGAQGLMQLMPSTAARIGVTNSFDPEDNIRGGMQHMRSLLDLFGNDLVLSLAAYNAGENLVQRIGRVPDIKETHDYVRRITKQYGKKETSLQPPVPAQAPRVFRFTDQQGVLHLTNIAPTRRSESAALSWQAAGQAPQ